MGLVALGILAIVLSFAAIASGRPDSSDDVGGTATFDFASQPESVEPLEGSITTEEPENTVTEEPLADGDDASKLTTVIVGDSNSIGDPAEIWLGPASEQLDWDSVVNLSAPGRGYFATPRECDDSPCAPFPGTVDAVVELEPDVVMIFGGVADGDVPLTATAAQYFADLREALPDAQIIAISPVYSAESVPAWGPLHRESIRAGVEAAGGTFVDVGQPALGDGETMSAESHAEVAQAVTENLQN